MAALSWLRLPFTIGYHTVISDGDFKQDAFVSAIVCCLALTSVSIATLYAFFVGALPWAVSDAVLCVHFSATAVVMCFFIAGRKGGRHLSPSIRAGAEAEQTTSDNFFQRHLVIIGMAVFYVLTLVHMIGHVVSLSSCTDQILTSRVTNTTEFAFGIIFDILFVIYTSALFLFCHVFHDSVFRQTPAVRYALFMVLSSTVAMWVALYTNEKLLENVLERNGSLVPTPPPTVPPNSTAPRPPDCLDEMNGFFLFMLTLYPASIEFALMALEIVVHVSTSHEISREDGRPDDTVQPASDPPRPNGAHRRVNADRRDVRDAASGDDATRFKGVVGGNDGIDDSEVDGDERQALGGEQSPSDRAFNVHDANDANVIPGRGGERQPLLAREQVAPGGGGLWPGVAAAVTAVMCIALLIVAYFTRMEHNGNHGNHPSYRRRVTYYSMTTAYLCIVIAIILAAFRTLSLFKSRLAAPNTNKYSGLEVVFVLASGGGFVECVLVLLAGVDMLVRQPRGYGLDPGPEAPGPAYPAVVITSALLTFAEMYLLTPLVVHVGRVRSADTAKVTRVKVVLLVLAIYNSSVWLRDTFILHGSHEIRAIKHALYGDAIGGLDFALEPIVLFYRFTGAMLLFSLYFGCR